MAECPDGWTKIPSFSVAMTQEQRSIDPAKPRYIYGGMASGEGRLHMVLDTHTGKPEGWYYRDEALARVEELNAKA